MVNSLGAGRAEDRLAGRARLLSGHRAVGSEPGRSRQPPARRLRPPRAALLDEVDRRSPLPGAERASAVAELVDQLGRRPDQAALDDGRPAAAAGLPELFLTGRYVPLATDVTVDARRRGVRADPRRARRRSSPCLDCRTVDQPARAACRSAATPGRRRGFSCPPELAGRAFRHEITGAVITPTTSRSVLDLRGRGLRDDPRRAAAREHVACARRVASDFTDHAPGVIGESAPTPPATAAGRFTHFAVTPLRSRPVPPSPLRLRRGERATVRCGPLAR